MKYRILIVALLAGITISCDDQLKIEPVDSIDAEQALADAQSIQGLLVGAYDRLSDDDVYGGWFQMTSDLLGTNENLSWGGTFFDPRALYEKTQVSNNFQVEETWTESYEVINVANLVLANLDKVDDPDDHDRIEGEAKFIRATVYFELVRLFAKSYNDGDPAANPGIPLVLTPTRLDGTITPENFVSRESVADVYAQILSDLTDADDNNLVPSSNGYFATSWTVKAMLARVYLQMKDYDNARIKANEVIESGEFALINDVARAFNQRANTREDIFAIQVTPQDGVNSLQTFYASRGNGGRRDIRIRPGHEALYDPSDERLTTLVYSDASRRLSGKYVDQFANISIIRLAEMYLIRAEGNLLAGGPQEGPNTPGEDLQVLRTRAKAPDAPVNPTIDDIRLERILELCFEGHFLHDIKRYELMIDQIPDPGRETSYDWNEDILVLPIPQRERDANVNLPQNPGY